MADWYIDHYDLWWMCSFPAAHLREALHGFELDLSTAITFDDPTIGFWQYWVEACRQALAWRNRLDADARAQQRKLRPKRRAEIDFEDIKSKIDIIEYIGRYIPLKKQGASYHGVCIFHPDKDPSLVVWPNIQAFRCFGCDLKGDVVTFRRLLTERGIR